VRDHLVSIALGGFWRNLSASRATRAILADFSAVFGSARGDPRPTLMSRSMRTVDFSPRSADR
jgi:hypothetical protein